MADKRFLQNILKIYEYRITSIRIDDLGYNVYEVKGITNATKDTDTVILGYSTQEENGEIIATTHHITLSELTGADSITLGEDGILCDIH